MAVALARDRVTARPSTLDTRLSSEVSLKARFHNPVRSELSKIEKSTNPLVLRAKNIVLAGLDQMTTNQIVEYCF
jgi:hypothetical protein